MDGGSFDKWLEENVTRTTDEVAALDVRALKRAGLIGPGQEVVEGIADLAWTPCNFGGFRPWFLCPSGECGKRVAILYLSESGQLLCRHCCELTYASQHVGELGRAELRAEKGKARLPPARARPKGMHHATFLKRTRSYVEALEELEAVRQERLARLAWRRKAQRVRQLK